MNFIETAEKNREKAQIIIRDLGIEEIWRGIGAEVNLVGSVKSGLLMKNLDIDFHIYTDELVIADSFAAVEKLAEHPSIRSITYTNLIHTEEECMEWHAWYEESNAVVWQLDMIHIRRGSAYDGVVEKVTDGIIRLLTPETREAVLRIKNEVPETVKVPGIDIYRAVFTGNVRNYKDFTEWIASHPSGGVFGWIP